MSTYNTQQVQQVPQQERESVRLLVQLDTALQDLEAAIGDISDKIAPFCCEVKTADSQKVETNPLMLSPFAENIAQRIARIRSVTSYVHSLINAVRF